MLLHTTDLFDAANIFESRLILFGFKEKTQRCQDVLKIIEKDGVKIEIVTLINDVKNQQHDYEVPDDGWIFEKTNRRKIAVLSIF